MTNEGSERHPEEIGIEALLQQVGPRKEPSKDVVDAVQAAVYAEWHAMLQERRRRRRSLAGIAAVLAFIVLISGVGLYHWSLDRSEVAVVSRIDGRLLTGGSNGAWNAAVAGQPIAVGDTVRTDAYSRAAMRLDQSVSLRLDRHTMMRMTAVDTIELTSGAIYVDARPELSTRRPIIQTHLGSVQHVGTQYEARIHPEVVEVSVREGRVTFGEVFGKAGERIRINTRGVVTRASLSPRDSAWDWAVQAGPAFDIDDQPLSDFLTWVARETGRKVVYAGAQVQAEAAAVKLKGSISGLHPETALAAVLSTTHLKRYDTGDEELIGITRAANDPLRRDPL